MSTAFRNRIVGSGEERPDQLLANPANWRIHPRNQQDALKGSLESVGWVQQVMVNKRTGYVVDGHARVALALTRDEPTVPWTEHGTQKPVECMERPLRNHAGDVYDPFMGSGTTLVAAERVGRKAYGMEIDPRYVAVAIERWETFTGKTAERLDGR